jgi:imidazolonepropionase-like amidohydrolase
LHWSVAQARIQSLAALDPDSQEAGDLINHLVAQGVAVTSTLTVFEASIPGQPRASSGALDAMAPDARDRYLRQWSVVAEGGSRAEAQKALFRKMVQLERRFADAGGLLVAGTDPTGYGGVVAGYANQRAVELLAQAGFGAEEAIRIATANGATYLGIIDEVGTVEAGKAADLVVIDGDPSTAISDIRAMETVFKRGIDP